VTVDQHAALTATRLIHQVSRELTNALERRLAPYGLTAQQAALLINATRGETSPKRLTSLLGTDTAGMTRLLDRLEAKGLVRRRSDSGDRRAIIIEVMPEGRALVPTVAPAFGGVAQHLLTGFSAEEVRQLTALLQRMVTNLDSIGRTAVGLWPASSSHPRTTARSSTAAIRFRPDSRGSRTGAGWPARSVASARDHDPTSPAPARPAEPTANGWRGRRAHPRLAWPCPGSGRDPQGNHDSRGWTMADVFDVLRQDHEEVKAMLAKLEAGPTAAAGATASQLEGRKKLTEQVIIEESKHEAVEEEYFWPAVREQGAEGNRVTDRAISQEQDAKRVLAELDKLGAGDQQFERLLTGFTADAREHIAFEEEQAWPVLRAGISAEQAREIGEKLVKGKQSAPTRPHPHTPPSEGVLKAAGPAASAADKLRDAATGRGRD
jgi:DNA-binding MarR family transcriptional regulator